MNPNVLDNIDTLTSGKQNWDKLKALIPEADLSASFEQLIDRTLEYSEPLPYGHPNASDSEKETSSRPVNYQTEQLPIMPVNDQTLELSFFTYLPRTNRYSPSVTANWYMVTQKADGSKEDKLVLQEYVALKQLNKNGISYSEKAEKILGLLAESMQAFDEAWQIKHKPKPSANLRRFLGSLVSRG